MTIAGAAVIPPPNPLDPPPFPTLNPKLESLVRRAGDFFKHFESTPNGCGRGGGSKIKGVRGQECENRVLDPHWDELSIGPQRGELVVVVVGRGSGNNSGCAPLFPRPNNLPKSTLVILLTLDKLSEFDIVPPSQEAVQPGGARRSSVAVLAETTPGRREGEGVD